MTNDVILYWLLLVLIKVTKAEATIEVSGAEANTNCSLRGSSREADHKITLTLDNPRAHLSSPGFPHENYPPNTEIIYDIEIKLDDEVMQLSTRILLTFEMFEIEPGEFCTNDFVEVEDSENQVIVYCGSQVGRTILAEGSKIRVRFVSNSIIESRGYSILVGMYSTQCSQHFTGVNSGTFSSPNHPGRYYAEDICVWKIDAPEGKRVKVKFSDTFDIRAYEPLCVQDYLSVSLTGDFSTHVKRYCHGSKPGTLLSTSNSMLFKFRTDCCFEGKGFSASFAIVDSDDITPTEPPEPKPQTCKCGTENLSEDERIMGGKVVNPPNRYPWMVALVKKTKGEDEYFCGAALISRQYVLTAAHCIQRETVSGVRVALGAHNSDASPDPVPVSEFILHPQYHNRTQTNDIALVKLEYSVNLEATVNLVCLPTTQEFSKPEDLALVAGWGWQRFHQGKYSKELQELEISIGTNAYCQSKYGGVILDTNICAGGEKGKDACSGDSGGPLVSKYDGKWYSVGVVSWGMGCGVEGYPGVYTRVSEYLEWIADNIKDSPPCKDDVPPPIKPNLDDCGEPNQKEESRIAGGVETEPFEFPWMAMIVYNRTVVGAGALISPFYVLTVASIFDNWMEWYPEVLDVFLGKHVVAAREATAQKFDVQAVYHHSGYGVPSPYNNDLALIRLEKAAGAQYRPICLPRHDAWYPEDLDLTTAGWGRVSDAGLGSEVLLKADMSVWPDESCNNRYPGWFTDKMICAYKDGIDTCEGDNGAPLMRLYYGRYYLAGLSSWASKDGCAVYGAPRVFSAVHANLKWITEKTGLETD
ncbi:hypothetical protein JTE90_014511 [Oedothorax gibbosus]|uniref:Uncharacterized protein n=1 Tax=Oedothorax gibbosus TaxID=931172 RepID=A0AAV6VLI1_9ARAC|nr:hypothetical protein JTE90_014511 [Oedothorax gibbosus]